MKLAVFLRTLGKRSELTRIRREGDIPAVVYGHDQSQKSVFLKGDEFHAFLRKLKSGLLATTIFELEHEGKTFRALIKEVQYHPVTYAVMHIDFLEIVDDVPVAVNVPIQIVGLAECAGVKLGGFMRQVIRSMKVSCLPRHLPQEFTLNITELGVAQSMRLSDIAVPEGVRPIAKMNEVAVIIAKKA